MGSAVTARRADDDVFPPEAFLSAYPDEIRALAETLRAVVRRATPDAIERVRSGWRLIGYDLPVGRRTVYFAWVAPEPAHVHLGWQHGIFMDDPDRMLEGAHLKLRKVRYTTFQPGDTVPETALVELTRQAAGLAAMTREERLALTLDRDLGSRSCAVSGAIDPPQTRLEAVVFDFGETLIDETREWSAWADRAGIPRLTFLAVLGRLIAEGRHHQEIFDVFGVPRPGEGAAGDRGPRPTGLHAEDLYPDARPCLMELRRLGLRIGIAGNQPDRAAEILATVGIELDLVATSAAWGVEKPSPAFFARIASELALPPEAIAYVGDRVDNDVIPAAAAGMTAIFIRRGPWAWIQCPVGSPPEAAFVIEDLTSLPDLVRTHGRGS